MAVPALSPRSVTVTAETGSGNTATMTGNAGTFSIADLINRGTDKIDVRNRGDHVAYIEGDGREYTWELPFTIGSESDMTNAGSYRLYDMVHKSGLYASDTSLETIGCNVWAIKLTIAMSCGGKAVTIVWDKVIPSLTIEMTEEHLTATLSVRSPNPPTIT